MKQSDGIAAELAENHTDLQGPQVQSQAPFQLNTQPDAIARVPPDTQFTRRSVVPDDDDDGSSEDFKDAEKGNGEATLLSEDEVIASLPSWQQQITLRAILVGSFLGVAFSFITMRFSLGPGGIVPTFNMPLGLLSFVLLRPFTGWLLKRGWTKVPFTAQENTVAQTLGMAATGAIWCLGFGSYIFGMSTVGYNLAGGDLTAGNRLMDTYVLSTGRIIGYGLCIVFIGIFINLLVRKPLVIDYNLPYPSGTATGLMINSFFSNGELAKQQAKRLAQVALGAFTWDFWTWFTSGNCATIVQSIPNFTNTWSGFPNLGFKAYAAGWWFDFTIAYVGAGFITPLAVNISMMIGAVISWGIAWPLLAKRAGSWYPAEYQGTSSFRGDFAYKVFWSIALYIGDGGYQVVRMLIISFRHFRAVRRARKAGVEPQLRGAISKDGGDALGLGIKTQETEAERRLRTRNFCNGGFHWSISAVGYAVTFIIGCVAIPHIFPPVKWYYVAIGFILVPFMGVANSYGGGLTDQDNSSMYGKLCIFIFAAWAGTANGGVIAGLGMCGVVLAATSQAFTLMQDFRTGYYTLASPRALFCVQLLGALLGVVVSPGIYQFYNHAFKIGVDYQYSAPYAGIYRGMAIVAANGASSLPKYCLAVAGGLLLTAIAMNLIRDFLMPGKYKKFMPIPSAVSLPFYLGAPIAIDFCLGGAIRYFWSLINPASAAAYGIVTGAGLMVGDGLWQLPYGILGIAKVTQPICMAFFKGVTETASAEPLSAANMSSIITELFNNPNGVTGSLANSSFSAADVSTMTTALSDAIASAATVPPL